MQPQGQTHDHREPPPIMASRSSPPETARAGITKAHLSPWARMKSVWGPTGLLRLETGIPEATRAALAAMGWKIGRTGRGFGARYECIENRQDGKGSVVCGGERDAVPMVCALAY